MQDGIIVTADDAATGGLAYHGLRDTEDGGQTLYHTVENKSERIPLLRDRRSSEDVFTSSQSPDDGSHPQNQWEGEVDSSGLPWWKRPSVRTLQFPSPCHIRWLPFQF